ncbi:hypothetical protein HELRODRAFT_167427 [Helobdella robusta]|uniref:Uncharacterized protein n=1 Tax=Helobdella robusta TaxID=6412 RepID=T1EZC9_HELRO|nr:hypothetical protein HELRODRAFT_167427 [Helobdella robusta]ESO10914.1 hypothetical protein HELRODRAFT_167427 [Helobdella robusta]
MTSMNDVRDHHDFSRDGDNDDDASVGGTENYVLNIFQQINTTNNNYYNNINNNIINNINNNNNINTINNNINNNINISSSTEPSNYIVQLSIVFAISSILLSRGGRKF